MSYRSYKVRRTGAGVDSKTTKRFIRDSKNNQECMLLKKPRKAVQLDLKSVSDYIIPRLKSFKLCPASCLHRNTDRSPASQRDMKSSLGLGHVVTGHLPVVSWECNKALEIHAAPARPMTPQSPAFLLVSGPLLLHSEATILRLCVLEYPRPHKSCQYCGDATCKMPVGLEYDVNFAGS